MRGFAVTALGLKRIVLQRSNSHALAYLPVAIIVGPDGAQSARMVSALIDTGADHTVVRGSILQELRILETGRSLDFTGAGVAMPRHWWYMSGN